MNTNPTLSKRLLAAAVAALLAGQALAAEEKQPCEHCHPAKKDAAAAAPAAGDTRVELADVTLLDQHGQQVPFQALVTGEQLVVMDFVFTTCTTVCPVLSAIMARLQEKLGDRLGKDVRLVSVSIDPVRDTPGRLEAYAARFKAKPGWTWLTGTKEDVDRVLRGLDAYATNISDHAPVILVGGGRGGSWTRFNGFPKQDQVLARIDALTAARAKAVAQAPSTEQE
jgi:protein SCO1/2